MLGAVAILYALAFVFLFSHRKSTAFKTRSPKLVLVSVVFLCIDSMGNTVLYSFKSDQPSWKWKCVLSIFVELCFVTVIMMVFLRMYRIFKVYSSYNQYLSD